MTGTSLLRGFLPGISLLPNYVARVQIDMVRWATKKAGGSTRISAHRGRPKHRGPKVKDGEYVQAGKMLAKQYRLRYYPGLHVGFGKNGTLFAREAGRVVISTEKVEPNFKHFWIKKVFAEKKAENMYRKFYNVIPEKQIGRFVLVDQV